MKETIVSVKDLKIHYHVKVKKGLTSVKKVVRAVDGVSLDIYKGETLGIVGESGCGKSTLCKAIIGLEKPTAGSVVIDGKNVIALSRGEAFEAKRRVQMVFQDVYSTLDPRFTVAQSIAEPMEVHKIGDKASRRERIKRLVREVGLPETYIDRFPHEFSGGQRQRIGIARALALDPEIILCDEPVSALDVSIQAQILNLMKDLQESRGFTYVFVSHNLSVVKHLCSRIAVMYLGSVVELADCDSLTDHPKHPYTIALIGAVPNPDPEQNREVSLLEGDIPSPINVPPGCPFATRCPQAKEICREAKPELREVGGGHMVACHFVEAEEMCAGTACGD